MKVAFVIGRFQPLHNGHKALLDTALRVADRVVVVLGDTGCAPDHRDPWCVGERIDMIRSSYPGCDRIAYTSVEDIPYDNDAWASCVHNEVATLQAGAEEAFLVGYKKDASSFYLDLFPDWQFVPAALAEDGGHLSATDVRRALYKQRWSDVNQMVPRGVFDRLSEMPARRRDALADEFFAAQDEELAWQCAAVGKYGGPILTTVDAVILVDDHVLVVERGGEIGRGAIALPGGFVNPDERLGYAAMRELKEETGLVLGLSDRVLCRPGATVAFDYPKRSGRGRVITNVFQHDLLGVTSDYPVLGADDAKRAFWMPLSKFQSSKRQFFDDHWHIVNHFVSLPL